jgi:hypothetical protein
LPGPNPTTSIYNASFVNFYNASFVNFYNATGSLVRFENKNILFFFEKLISAILANFCRKNWRFSQNPML